MSIPEDALVVFTPSGHRGRFPLGTPVLEAARALGVDIDSVCGGRGLCGRCQVDLCEGSFAKHGVASAASMTSNSTPEKPSSFALRKPASVFSGASVPPPRWAMMRA